MHRILHWTPRVLAIGFAAFLALFALDVFGEYETVGETLIALFMHLIPVLLLLVATALAWRWPLVGGALFLILGIASIFFFGTYRHIVTFALVSLPVLVLSLLFLWDGLRAR